MSQFLRFKIYMIASFDDDEIMPVGSQTMDLLPDNFW